MSNITVFFGVLVVLSGFIAGSFFNAFVWRFRRPAKMTERNSKCVHCGRPLLARDLLPLVSFFLLRGQCRFCKKPIPWHYPVVELATGLILIPPYFLLGPSLSFLASAAFILVLELLFLLDLRYSVLPDRVTLPGVVVAVLVAAAFHRSFGSIVIGGILGGGFFALQFFFSRGRWIGGGDIRLGFVMGVALGWQLLMVALFLSYIIGAATGLLLIFFKRKTWKSSVPFGTFLTVATYAALLWGESLLATYASALSLAS